MTSRIVGARGTGDGRDGKNGFKFLIGVAAAEMEAQKALLLSKGFIVGQNGAYPAIHIDDVERALKLFWKTKVVGWWRYREHMIEHGVCTAEEFDAAAPPRPVRHVTNAHSGRSRTRPGRYMKGARHDAKRDEPAAQPQGRRRRREGSQEAPENKGSG